MNDKTSPEDFYKQQQDIWSAVDRLPAVLDDKIANRLRVHEARISERLLATERRVLAIIAVGAVIGGAIVAIAVQ